MHFMRQRLPAVIVPRVYAYEAPRSQLATDAGLVYMLQDRIYACLSRLGDSPEQDQDFVLEMVRLAFEFDVERTNNMSGVCHIC